MRLKSIFSVQNIASVNFQKVCSSTRPSSQTKGGLTCEIVAAEVGFLFVLRNRQPLFIFTIQWNRI